MYWLQSDVTCLYILPFFVEKKLHIDLALISVSSKHIPPYISCLINLVLEAFKTPVHLITRLQSVCGLLKVVNCSLSSMVTVRGQRTYNRMLEESHCNGFYLPPLSSICKGARHCQLMKVLLTRLIIRYI